MAEKGCYTVKELQEILGVSRPTVYNLLKKNEFMLNYKIDILNFFEKMRYGIGRRRETSWIEKK